MDDLPSPHILHKRNPSYSNKCHLCQQASFALHWIICPTCEPILKIIEDSLHHVLKPNKMNISQSTANDLYTQIIHLDSLQIHHSRNKPSLFSTLTGLIPLDIIHTLSEYTASHKTARTLTIQLLLHINQLIYTNIWIPYCIDRSQNHQLHPQHPTSAISLNSISQSTNHTQDYESTTHIPILKIETWLTKWIKYSTHPSDIFTYIQI